jgi:hypothetical protein
VPTLRSEFLARLSVDFDATLVLGARRILHASGGSCAGPGLEGDVLRGGGDWVLERRDGIAELDIRFLLRTHDAQLVYLSARGLADIPQQARERIRAGEDVDPASYYFRTAWCFETQSERHARLNRLIAVGMGRRTASGMVTELFEIK